MTNKYKRVNPFSASVEYATNIITKYSTDVLRGIVYCKLAEWISERRKQLVIKQLNEDLKKERK